MAIASVGTLGTGANSTSNSSYTFNTATNSLASGDFGILVNVTDNTSTVDGDNNEHTSVSGGTGTWTKLGEYTNANGAAAAGVTTSVWLFEASGTVSVGTTITMNYASARVDKTASFWKFTKGGGTTIILDTAPGTNPITSQVDASNGFGSSAFSGLASAARLYFRGLGKEANSTTQITVSSSFTAITLQRSRNNASAQLVRGEFRINTSTGETSNPTLAVSGDTAGLFISLVEFTPTVVDADLTETATATETATTTLAATAARVETATATETATTTLATSGAVTEPATTTDAVAGGVALTVALSETSTLTEAESGGLLQAVDVVEGFAGWGYGAWGYGAWGQTYSFFDAIDALVTLGGNLTETATATEIVTAQLAAVGAVTETATTTETETAILATSAARVETATVTETETASLAAVGAVSELATATETETAQLAAVAARVETATATETQAAQLAAVAARVEAATVTDTVAGGLAATAARDETATVTDAVTGEAAVPAARVEVFTVTQDQDGDAVGGSAILEQATVAEQVDATHTKEVALVDGVSLLDGWFARLLWEPIPDSGGGGWVPVNDGQGASWVPAPAAGGRPWVVKDDSQGANWQNVDDSNGANWRPF